ncbi:MAG: alpha-1,2-fucosyltransferase [Gemmatimonadaceae bacterium]
MRKPRKIVVRLKGGLGNQMFQYAAAFAVAARNGMELVVDTRTGFARDRLYRRSFSLDKFNVSDRHASFYEQMPFWLEAIADRFIPRARDFSGNRPWGLHIVEKQFQIYPELISRRYDRSIWLDGGWQTEKYFEEMGEPVADRFRIPEPREEKFVALVSEIRQRNAIAIGIRLYEEAPPGAHDAAPFSFYEQAARRVANDVENPVFYLFCTMREPIDGKLDLPGDIRYVTHDDGYTGELNRLWLLTRFRCHVISNSSFYWWGAWLAEKTLPEVRVWAADLFPNPETIPERWEQLEVLGPKTVQERCRSPSSVQEAR